METIERFRYPDRLRSLRHGSLSGESIPFLGADNGATSHGDKDTDRCALLLNLANNMVLNNANFLNWE